MELPCIRDVVTYAETYTSHLYQQLMNASSPVSIAAAVCLLFTTAEVPKLPMWENCSGKLKGSLVMEYRERPKELVVFQFSIKTCNTNPKCEL